MTNAMGASAPLSALILGANGTIGSAIATRLASQGFDICSVSRRQIKPLLPGEHFQGDLTDPDFIRALARRAATPWVLVHSVGTYCRVLPPSATEYNEIMRLNLHSVEEMLEVFVPLMEKAGGGRIILISSIAAWRGSRCPPYAESKRALLKLAAERCALLARKLITINALLPGPVNGPFFSANCDAQRRKQILDEIPMGRYASAEDISAAVAFLASADAGYISGAAIPISGGLI